MQSNNLSVKEQNKKASKLKLTEKFREIQTLDRSKLYSWSSMKVFENLFFYLEKIFTANKLEKEKNSIILF